MGICCSCTTVDSGTVGIVEKWGKFNDVKQPGFVFLWPGESVAHRQSMKLQQLKVTCESKSKDNVFVELTVSVHYRILKSKVQESYYEMENPQSQIRAYVFDVIRSEVPKKTLDEIFVVKEQLASAIKNQLSNTMEKYGFLITATPVTDINPAHVVKIAFNERLRQENLKVATTEKAEADKIVEILRAEANAETIRINAKAEADAKHYSGQGLSRQRQAIIDGLCISVKNFQQGVSDADTKNVMDLILLTQYFDTLQNIGNSKTKGCNTLFLPTNPGSVHDISSQVRQGFLESLAASKTTVNTDQTDELQNKN